ncbi:MAG: hypothetical protein KJZ65_02725 [Phycisphaerales bacterium]|nr:hypothetical protein [Phycisphaerales bacterium]
MVRNAVFAGLVGLAASAASADIASFGFTDLNGSFNLGSMQFTAMATAGGTSSTAGDVTRFAEGGGNSAEFDSGFFGGGSMADVQIIIDVSNVVGPMADGNGSFTITDADGDTITGTVSGTWFAGAMGFVFMNGHTTGITFNSTGDGMFEGPSGGAFSITGLVDEYFGALSILLRTPQGVGFFNTSFSEVSTQADGLIVPTPATIALAGCGLALTVRRRR